MTRREVLERFIYYCGGCEHRPLLPVENIPVKCKEDIDQALSDLAQIEESERLSVEETEEIIRKGAYNHASNTFLYSMEDIRKSAQAIYEAQERKSKGGEKC